MSEIKLFPGFSYMFFNNKNTTSLLSLLICPPIGHCCSFELEYRPNFNKLQIIRFQQDYYKTSAFINAVGYKEIKL